MKSMGEDSMFFMFEWKSSDKLDDSNDAEDGNDEDCSIYTVDAFIIKNYTARLPAAIRALVVSIYIDKIDMMILLISLSFELFSASSTTS